LSKRRLSFERVAVLARCLFRDRSSLERRRSFEDVRFRVDLMQKSSFD